MASGIDPVRRAVLAGLAVLPAACTPPPQLAEGETGRVVRVGDGDLLALHTGLEVRLVEIEAPSMRRGGSVLRRVGGAAAASLSAAALGRTATLWYGGLTRDRYDRALAHVLVDTEAGGRVWLNAAMVGSGLARVRTWPDNAFRARELLAIEAEARRAGKPVWTAPDWRVLSPAEAAASRPAFALVEGVMAKTIQAHAGGALGVLSEDGVALAGLDRLGPPDTQLRLEPGARIRVRGRVARTGSAAIELTHWAQLENA